MLLTLHASLDFHRLDAGLGLGLGLELHVLGVRSLERMGQLGDLRVLRLDLLHGLGRQLRAVLGFHLLNLRGQHRGQTLLGLVGLGPVLRAHPQVGEDRGQVGGGLHDPRQLLRLLLPQRGKGRAALDTYVIRAHVQVDRDNLLALLHRGHGHVGIDLNEVLLVVLAHDPGLTLGVVDTREHVHHDHAQPLNSPVAVVHVMEVRGVALLLPLPDRDAAGLVALLAEVGLVHPNSRFHVLRGNLRGIGESNRECRRSKPLGLGQDVVVDVVCVVRKVRRAAGVQRLPIRLEVLQALDGHRERGLGLERQALGKSALEVVIGPLAIHQLAGQAGEVALAVDPDLIAQGGDERDVLAGEFGLLQHLEAGHRDPPNLASLVGEGGEHLGPSGPGVAVEVFFPVGVGHSVELGDDAVALVLVNLEILGDPNAVVGHPAPRALPRLLGGLGPQGLELRFGIDALGKAVHGVRAVVRSPARLQHDGLGVVDPHDPNLLLVGLRAHDLRHDPNPAQAHARLVLEHHVVSSAGSADVLDMAEDAIKLLRDFDVALGVNRQSVERGLVLAPVVHHLHDELVGAVERQARPALAKVAGGVVPLLGIGGVGEQHVLGHARVLLAHVLPGVLVGFFGLLENVLCHQSFLWRPSHARISASMRVIHSE